MVQEKLEILEKIICPTDAENVRNSEGSIIPVKDGGLLLVYSRFRGGSSSDFAPSDIVSRRSQDGGLTWTEPEVICQSPSEGNALSASLIRLNSGKIALFYQRSFFVKGPSYAKGDYEDISMPGSKQVMRVSADGGVSWSEEVSLSPPGEYCQFLLNDCAVLLSTGRVILPNYYGLSPFDGREFVQPIYSDDDGKTWQRSEYRLSLLGVDTGLSESSIVELADGRLLMTSRTGEGFVFKSYSSDCGRTWTKAVSTGLPASQTPTSLARIPGTEDVLLIWNQVSTKEWSYGFSRHRLTCAISSDGGGTWHHFKNLESLDDRARIPAEEGGKRTWQAARATSDHARKEAMKELNFRSDGPLVAEYTSLVFVGDMAVITYDVAPTPGCSLKLRITPVDWFYR